jgi:hypothetical protein
MLQDGEGLRSDDLSYIGLNPVQADKSALLGFEETLGVNGGHAA